MSNLSALAATSFRSPHELSGTPTLETAAREFESYLLGEFLRLSEAASLYEGPMDGGHAGRMMRSLFHQEVARIVSENGGFGIAKMIAEDPATAEATPEGEDES